MQVSETLIQFPTTDVPATQIVSFFHVSVPLKLTGHDRCSVIEEGVQEGAGGWYAAQKASCQSALYAPG